MDPRRRGGTVGAALLYETVNTDPRPVLIDVCRALHQVHTKLGNSAKARTYLQSAYDGLEWRARNIPDGRCGRATSQRSETIVK